MSLSKFACNCLGNCETSKSRRRHKISGNNGVHQNSNENNDQAHKLPDIQLSPYFSGKITTLYQTMNFKTRNDLLITLKRLEPQNVNLDEIYNDKNNKNNILSTEMAYQLYNGAFALFLSLLNDDTYSWNHLVDKGFVVTSSLLMSSLDMFYNGIEIKNMLLNSNNLWKHGYLACLYRIICRFLKGYGFSPNCIMDQRIICCILHIVQSIYTSNFPNDQKNSTLDFITIWKFYQLLPKKFFNVAKYNVYVDNNYNTKFYHFICDEQNITRLLLEDVLDEQSKILSKQNKILSKQNKTINYHIKHKKINRDYVLPLVRKNAKARRNNCTQQKKKKKTKLKNNCSDDMHDYVGKTWNKWQNKLCANIWLSEPYIKIENWFKPFDNNQILNHKLNKKTLTKIGLIHNCYVCNKTHQQVKKLFLCRGCKKFCYCSKKHQKQHWKNQHSAVCQRKLKK